MAGYETVLRHIDQLRLYLQRIYELQSHPKEQVLYNWHVQFQIDRALQLTVEVVIRIAQQLIAILNLPIPDSNKEAMQALVSASILPEGLGTELSRAVGFRNIIVHGYMDIDYNIVYDVLQSDVTYVEKFVAQVAAFVKDRMSSDE